MANFITNSFKQPSEEEIAQYEIYTDRNGKEGKHYVRAYFPGTVNATLVVFIVSLFFYKMAFLLVIPLLIRMIAEKLFLQVFSLLMVGFSLPILVMLSDKVLMHSFLLFHPWIVLTLYFLMLLFLLSNIPMFKKRKLLNSGCTFRK